MPRVHQEFYCRVSGGGCGGYFYVPLNPAINKRVLVICPKCAHEHFRSVQDGEICEHGRYAGSGEREEILASIASYTKTPRTKKFLSKKSLLDDCDSAVIKSPDDLAGEVTMMQRWIERAIGGT